ncbi:methyl-accepting chemotaxis (MCP) signaling domain protein [Collimonas arenae]|uniref:Methyl-accepting chemotaxis (MCP) signaling domain protein n=1 Tax=Collimonas arenae TaxID=279058 RepID=A0A127PK49_9BURK|nr:methyl-accepting chemotaxis protein [Collimonas arenae]AMO98095.1 methyl-accepting chemotaxis (MCP) signaling domain protein [Collimonas arenae]AMP07962.1 methyl-accepting chemotaxis (MCP) signaling domain protein [Collimonas arenae]
MNIANLKISTRLTALSTLLILTSALMGMIGWRSLYDSDARSADMMQNAEDFQSAVNLARKAQVDFKIEIQEWKDLLLRGNDAAAFEKHKNAFLKKGEETRAELAQLDQLLRQLDIDAGLAKQASQTNAELEQKYLTALKQFAPARIESGHVVDKLVTGLDREPTKRIEDIVGLVVEHSKSLMRQSEAEATHSNIVALRILLAVVAVGTLVGSILTYWIINGITGPLRSAVKVARTVAAGDLTSHIEVGSKDEIGALMDALRHMNGSLQHIVGQCRSGIETMASASGQIATGNLDLSARTEEQAASLEQTAASMGELTSTVKQNADNARQANQLAASASGVAVEGGAVVSKVVTTMASINNSARKIVDIIAVIDGIAFQTNILALNAAVEAARAGEQGRGFAVVASEVRNLAQRSAAAAKEIKSLIGDSVEKVDAGSALVAEAGTTMEQIVDSVKRVSDIMAKITTAGEEQSSGIEQINQAIGNMDQVTQQNAALVEEAAAAAESLKEQAANLASVVSVFKLNAVAATGGSSGIATNSAFQCELLAA